MNCSSYRWFPRGLVSLAVLALCTVSATADDSDIVTVVVKLEQPKKTSKRSDGPAGESALDAWLPASKEPIRGVVLNPFYRQTAGQRHWRAACAHWNFALVGVNFFGVSKQEQPRVIADGLKSLAEKTGRPELANAPLCFVGMSAGAGMSVNLASALADRTIAAGPVCLEVGPRDAASREIPIVTVFGERDGRQMEKLLAKLPEERQAGARWAIAVQWGRKHEFGQANNLVLPWFDAAIRHRLPERLDLARGPAQLRSIPLETGWLGRVAGWEDAVTSVSPAADFDGETARTCWLPSQRVAATWQAFVQPERTIRILAPAGLGDKQPFKLHSPRKTIAVRATARRDAELTQLEVRLGERKLAELDEEGEAEIGPLPPGIHPLIVAGRDAAGQWRLSRPHTILVGE